MPEAPSSLHYHRAVLGLNGSTTDDLVVRAGVEMALGLRGVGKQAGRLDHDVHAQVLPGQLRGIALRHDALFMVMILTGEGRVEFVGRKVAAVRPNGEASDCSGGRA